MKTIRAFFVAIAKNWKLLLKEAVQLIRHSLKVITMFFPLNPKTTVRSETRPSSYKRVRDIGTIVAQPFVPLKRKSGSVGTVACAPKKLAKDAKTTRWFFINDITTALPLATLNGEEIATAFHRPVYLIHTPSYGAIGDLWQTVVARNLGLSNALVEGPMRVITEALRNHKRVVSIGHSQGTVTNQIVVQKLLENKETRDLVKKLEIYNFAGDYIHIDAELSKKMKRQVPYCEHFANSRDFVPNMGVLSPLHNSDGHVFVAKKSGHLMNAHYLDGFIKGDYCGGKSRLSRYLGGRTPTNAHYLT